MRHIVIPDTQVKPGVPTAHLGWIGQYIADKRPDKVIHLGDHWDMPSLSSYDKGKLDMEGRRYEDDVESGNVALRLLRAPSISLDQAQQTVWHLLVGNHEHRINRAVDDNPHLAGKLGLDDLDTDGWKVHPFLEVAKIDGVAYSHYFANPMSGRPYGGQCATRLKTIGCSFTMGHQQVLDYAMRSAAGGTEMHHGLIAGACYLHDEKYLGPQGNMQWRGIIVKNEVADGHYDIMLVSLDYLCRRYEGVTLKRFMRRRRAS